MKRERNDLHRQQKKWMGFEWETRTQQTEQFLETRKEGSESDVKQRRERN